MDIELKQFVELDASLVNAAKEIRVLSKLAWPSDLSAPFLESWNQGNPILPKTSYPTFDFSESKKKLDEVMKRCDQKHPVGRYIYQTAHSYILAAKMLENAGTPAFSEISGKLYGLPQDSLGNSKVSNLLAAEHFIKSTDDFAPYLGQAEAPHCLTPESVAEELRAQTSQFFKKHPVEVLIDKKLASKAAAGARRIRIRGETSFSELDIKQLLQHEAFVHTATMLNGREQPNLKSMGLGAPRTTSTQEGLATFAEFITSTMDISRLNRIALRIKAIDLGLKGANFIEVFKFFLDAGQSQGESYQSTARIFRGGDVNGRVVFTKDIVYLQGLMFVHTFLRKAIAENKVHYPRSLFVGRLTLGDVISLDEFIQSGFITAPLYQPPWVVNRECIAAYLCYAMFASRIRVSQVTFADFVEFDG